MDLKDVTVRPEETAWTGTS